MRPSGRTLDQPRAISIETGVARHAEGSCLIRMGDTHVLCTASVEDKPPPFLRNTGMGWVTADLACCPAPPTPVADARPLASNLEELKRFKDLSGQSLRSVVDRSALGERQS